MENGALLNLCIFDILDGLRDGLSHFSSPSRVALIYAVTDRDELHICDPQDLLREHEPKLQEVFLASDSWRNAVLNGGELKYVEEIPPSVFPVQLTGLITFVSRSRPMFFQAWFTEEHPDMCSTGPTRCWLEYASRLLSRNIASVEAMNMGTSGYVLQEYAAHAVRDYIVDQRNVRMGWDTRLRIFPTLDAILGISTTLEEGAWPYGELVFVEPSEIDRIDYIARFPKNERPAVINFKHVRKLLQAVEDAQNRKLVSDGKYIIGITTGALPPATVSADFHGGYGFLKLDGELICSFSDGRFHSTTRKANLVKIEEALLDANLNPDVIHDLFSIISQIVHSAGNRKHGCTLVIDLNSEPIAIPGQNLEKPLDLTKEHMLRLAKSLAKVDGALHVGADLKLHGFACLLDGHAAPGENRARGARYNSALRFTNEHHELLVVVVSSDRPVSVIQGGVELTAQCEWKSLSGSIASSPLLSDWMTG